MCIPSTSEFHIKDVGVFLEVSDNENDINITSKFVSIVAFFEGGRLTFNDVHYVQEGDNLTPAGETPFAKDAHFGFTSSNLKDWVVEKTRGLVKKEDVVSVGLRDIREGGQAAVANILESQVHGSTVIVNGMHIRVAATDFFVL